LESYRGCSKNWHETALAEEHSRLMRLVSATCMLEKSSGAFL